MSEIQITSTELVPFSYGTAALRAITIDGDPWFVSSDVLGLLDLNRSSVATLDDDEKGVHSMDTLGGAQQVSIISESGLYSLILRSRKPEAKAVKRWITHEVLPSIRRTGGYGSKSPAELTRREILQLALDAEDRADREEAARLEAESYAKELEPAARFAVAVVENDHDHFSVGEAAKLLQADLGLLPAARGLGQNKLFFLLATWGWIYKDARDRWRAKQEQVNLGRLAQPIVAEDVWNEKLDRYVQPTPQVRITGKGLKAIFARLEGGEAA